MDEVLVNSDRQFLADLHRLGSATVPQLCEAEGVTATAVRQRLIRLQASGLVSRQTVRASRGRPHHEYQLTELGKKNLGNNYPELAIVLWEQIRSIEDAELKKRLMSQLRDVLVNQYGGVSTESGIAERLVGLKDSLTSHGFNVEVEQDGDLLILKENHCPYHELASEDRDICELEHEVFETILGTSLELKQRCVDGHNCCRFELTESVESTSGSE